MSNNYQKGDRDTRPWGTWEVLDAGDGFCVKRICVTPGNILSLQSHNFRDEHWIIIKGEAVVTLGEDKLFKKANDAVSGQNQTPDSKRHERHDGIHRSSNRRQSGRERHYPL